MLEIEDLSVQFAVRDGNITAFEQFSFSVGPQEKLCIIGETGSGKSVLILALLRLLPDNAKVRGKVLLDGRDLFSMTPRQLCNLRAAEISYIPQGNGSALNPIMRVGKQIAERLRGTCSRADAQERAAAELEGMDMDRRWLRAYPHQLSGGMKQRAVIASGTIAKSRLILADEPTKGLDAQRIGGIAEIFNRMSDSALICVTHDLYFARAVAETVGVMYAAQMVELSPVKDFFEHPLHPYSQMMIGSLLENGMHYEKGFAPDHQEYDQYGCRFYPRCPYATDRCKQAPPMADVDGRKVRCWIYAHP